MTYLDLIKKCLFIHVSDPKNRYGWGWLCESMIGGGDKGNGIKMVKLGQTGKFLSQIGQ